MLQEEMAAGEISGRAHTLLPQVPKAWQDSPSRVRRQAQGPVLQLRWELGFEPGLCSIRVCSISPAGMLGPAINAQGDLSQPCSSGASLTYLSRKA